MAIITVQKNPSIIIELSQLQCKLRIDFVASRLDLCGVLWSMRRVGSLFLDAFKTAKVCLSLLKLFFFNTKPVQKVWQSHVALETINRPDIEAFRSSLVGASAVHFG